MRFIPTRIHGWWDYAVGLLLVVSPWLMGFTLSSLETSVPVVLGLTVIVYSLFTDYEAGMLRRLPMRTHLAFDFVTGLVLAVSPWLFGFSQAAWLPHLVMGLFVMAAALTTSAVPGPRRLEPLRVRVLRR